VGERPHIEPEQSAAAPPVRRRVRMRPPAREGRPFRRRGRDSAAPRQRAKRGGRGSPLLKTRVSGWPHPLDPHPGRGLPGGRPPTTSGVLGARARGSPPAPSSAALGGTKGAGARRKAGGVGRRWLDSRRRPEGVGADGRMPRIGPRIASAASEASDGSEVGSWAVRLSRTVSCAGGGSAEGSPGGKPEPGMGFPLPYSATTRERLKASSG